MGYFLSQIEVSPMTNLGLNSFIRKARSIKTSRTSPSLLMISKLLCPCFCFVLRVVFYAIHLLSRAPLARKRTAGTGESAPATVINHFLSAL
jgi:hypothetical protein